MDPSVAVPLCLPSNYNWDSAGKELIFQGNVPRGDLKVCEAGCELLKSIKEDLVSVICITGPARTGKSFFLSKLQEGVKFQLGHSTQSQTTGIWIALGPTPIQVEGKTARLVLLDAEGLDAVSTADRNYTEEWDRKVFSVCTLASSFLIYNSIGTPNTSDLDKLGFIAKFSETIFRSLQATSSEENEINFKQYSPHFLWLIRDAHLTPTVNGRTCTWEKFLTSEVLKEISIEAVPKKLMTERHTNSSKTVNNSASKTEYQGRGINLMKQRENLEIAKKEEAEGKSKKQKRIERDRNAVRKAIRTTFRSFNAFGLPCPSIQPEVLSNLQNPENEKQINPEFLQNMDEIKCVILSTSALKRIPGGFVTGGQLISLLESFVAAVNKECDNLKIDDTWTAVVKSQLSQFRGQAVGKYLENMSKIQLPLLHEQLLEQHEKEKENACALFDDCSKWFDENYQSITKANLLQEIAEKLTALEGTNEDRSREACQEVIKRLEETFAVGFETDKEAYTCNGLKKAKSAMEEEYFKTDKGPMINTIWKENETQIDEKINSCRLQILSITERNLTSLIITEAEGIQQRMPLETDDLDKLLKTLKEKYDSILEAKCNDCDICKSCKQNMSDKFEERSRIVQDFNKSSSEQYCQNLSDELRSEHLEKVLGSNSTKSFAGLEKVKKIILENYDKNAKGPAKIDVRSKCETDIKRKLTISQTSLANSSEKDAADEYRSSMRKILKKGPFEEKDLAAKSEEVASKIMHKFNERCAGMEGFKSRKAKVANAISNEMEHFLEKNFELSTRKCEKLALEILQQIKTSYQVLVSKLNAADNNDDLGLKEEREKIKQGCLLTFDEKGVGPAKSEVRKMCEDGMNKELQEHEEIVTRIAGKKASKKYQTLLAEAIEKGPYDSNILENIQAKSFSEVLTFFKKTCSEFQTPSFDTEKESLQSFIEGENKISTHRNSDMSRAHCESLRGNIMKQFRSAFQELVITLSDDNTGKGLNVSLEFNKIKEMFLKEYCNSAKGPYKIDIKSKIEEEMQSSLTLTKQELGNAALDMAQNRHRSLINILISEGPHDEHELKRLYEVAVAETVDVFKDNSSRFDQPQKNSQKHDLEIFLQEQEQYVTQRNKDMSREFCERLRVDMERSSHQWFKDLAMRVNSQDLEENQDIPNLKFGQKIDEILVIFDEKAKGPIKNELREKLKVILEEQMTHAEKDIADSAFRKATEGYQNFLLKIVEEDCNDMDAIQIKKQEAAARILSIFKDRCSTFDTSLIAVKEEKFKEFVQKQNANSYDAIFKKSLKRCEDARKVVVSQYKDNVKELLYELSVTELSHIKDVAVKFFSIRTNCLDKYESMSDGPAKVDIAIKCGEEMEDIFLSSNKEIADIAFRKSEEQYNMKIDKLMKEGPYGKQKLHELQTNISTDIMQSFREACAVVNSNTTTFHEEMLKKLIQDHNVNTTHMNSDRSRDLCEDVKEKLIHDCEKSYLKIIKFTSSQKIEDIKAVGVELSKIQVECLRQFEEKSKGNSKEGIKKKLTDELKKHFINTSEEIAEIASGKAQSRYRKEMETILQNGPYDEETIKQMGDNLALNIVHLYHEMCKGIDQKRMEEGKELLMTYIMNSASNIFHSNISRSQKICENHKNKSVESCKRSFGELASKIRKQHIDEIDNVLKALSFLKSESLVSYENMAKGPHKEEIRKTCNNEIDLELAATLSTIAETVIGKCFEKYKSELDRFIKQGPYEKQIVEDKSRDTKAEMWNLFTAKCRGLDEKVTNSLNKTLNVLVKENELILLNINFESSQIVCSKVKEQCVSTCRKNLDNIETEIKRKNIKYITNIENEIEEVGNASLERFREGAKGPAKDGIQKSCEDVIQRYLLHTKARVVHILMNKAKDIFTTMIEEVNRKGVLSEQKLKLHLDKAAQSSLKAFEEVCAGFNSATTATARQTLQSFIDNGKKYTTDYNFSSSQEFCESLKTMLVAECMEKYEEVISIFSGKDVKYILANLTQLDGIKKEFTTKFDKKASGPTRHTTAKAFASNVETFSLQAKSETANILLKSVKEEYHRNMQSVVNSFPLSAEELEKLEQNVAEKCAVFDIALPNIGKVVATTKKQEFDAFIKEKRKFYVAQNERQSVQTCRTLRTVTSEACERDLAQLFETVKSNPLDSPHTSQLVSKIQSTKQRHLQNYDANAKGPSKWQYRQECSSAIDSIIARTEGNLVVSLFTKTVSTYQTEVEAIIRTEPVSSAYLNDQIRIISSRVVNDYGTRVQGLRQGTAYNDQLKESMEQVELTITERNREESREMCIDLMKNMLDSDSYDDAEEFVRVYQQNGRGPQITIILEQHRQQIEKKFKRSCPIF